jgi:hypothetical protein
VNKRDIYFIKEKRKLWQALRCAGHFELLQEAFGFLLKHALFNSS